MSEHELRAIRRRWAFNLAALALIVVGVVMDYLLWYS